VGRWYSGQFKRPVFGIDGVLLLVVIGDGKLIIPVDFAIRRPDGLCILHLLTKTFGNRHSGVNLDELDSTSSCSIADWRWQTKWIHTKQAAKRSGAFSVSATGF
jgi:hypothetical protein